MRIRLTLRNKTFLFFGLIMPFGFFFVYATFFAKGDPDGVRLLLGPVIALAVMGAFWGLSVALVTFREQGILRRFHVTPVTSADMLASSIVANYLLILPTIVIELLLSKFIFHVSGFGDLLSLFIMVTVGVISFGSMGLVIASVTNTMQETQVLNQLIWFALIFLSGATVPFSDLPKAAQTFGVFLPATYLVWGLQDAIFRSAPIWHLWKESLSLLGWAMLAFFVAAQLFRWEPESKIPRNAKLWAVATALPFLLLGIWENHTGSILAQSQAAYRSMNHSNKDHQPSNPSETGAKPQEQPPRDQP
jgi:ABC-2 type transport system permease protein